MQEAGDVSFFDSCKKYFAMFERICFAFDPREPEDCSLLSDMSQRYNSNVDFSETQIIIWVERETGGKIFEYFILKKKKKKKIQAPQVRLELAASEFVSLRYYHLPTLQYNTRFICTMFIYLHNRKYTENCEI